MPDGTGGVYLGDLPIYANAGAGTTPTFYLAESADGGFRSHARLNLRHRRRRRRVGHDDDFA
jgi:hypothetical protein